MFIVALGALLVVVGVSLPWADVNVIVQPGGFEVSGSVSGIDIAAGKMNIILAIGNGALGFLTVRSGIRRGFVGFLVILASVAILTMTLAFADNPAGGELNASPLQEFGLNASFDLQIGLLVTIVGGALLLIGGLTLLVIPSRRLPNHVPGI